MLKIRAIKISLNTTKGPYGLFLEFQDGLNIVRGHNSSGKSTVFQSILYGLGMEELIGGKNEKAMQSVLKDEILNDEKQKEANVIESSILLEIENEKTITVERFVKSSTRDTKLVNVYDGALLTRMEENVVSTSLYVHDPGAASDVKFGFQAYLEEFLGYNLPTVQYNDGAFRKLYLQNIFPSFIIEQKAGWSDFLATVPFYNLRDKEKRAIEFMLKLDSWKIEELKQEIRRRKQELQDEWTLSIARLRSVADRSSTEIQGLQDLPSSLINPSEVYLTYSTPDSTRMLPQYISDLTEELREVEEAEIPKIEQISEQKENELQDLNRLHRRYSVQYDFLINQRNLSENNLELIQSRLSQIQEELYQNQQHLKLKNLGASTSVKIAKDICPACEQYINDTLLPQNSVTQPMSIEENIGYLQSQRSMAETYLSHHKADVDTYSKKTSMFEIALADLREKIRAIKRDLVSDGRLPSTELIERRITLKNRIEFYQNRLSEFETLKRELINIGNSWGKIIGRESELPKESFSELDFEKLKLMKYNFIRLLRRFDYASKSLDDLNIAKDKLIPVANGGYSIKFDSSASDLMRAIFAFSCCLFLTSDKYGGNHPRFLMFDEPGGQDTANSTLKELFLELESYNAQSIVFASFKQSEGDFKESTENVKFTLLDAKGRKFIRQLGEA